MKIPPLGVRLSHADGQSNRRTDMSKLIVAIRNFANVPKNGPGKEAKKLGVKKGNEDGRSVEKR